MLISFFLVIVISSSQTVRAQPSPRFHVEAWLPFRNCEMDQFNLNSEVILCRFFGSFGIENIDWVGISWLSAVNCNTAAAKTVCR